MATKNSPDFGWYIFLVSFSSLAIIGDSPTSHRTLANYKTAPWPAVGGVMIFFLSHMLKQRKLRHGDYSSDHFLGREDNPKGKRLHEEDIMMKGKARNAGQKWQDSSKGYPISSPNCITFRDY